MLIRTRAAAFYLFLSLTVFAGCLFWVFQKNQELARYRSELELEQESSVADSEATWLTTTSAIDGLLYRHEIVHEPLSRGEWQILLAAHSFFERRLARPRMRDSDDRVVDLVYFIEVSLKIRKYQDAETAINELLELTSNLPETSLELQTLRIKVLNWKACFQVNFREPEAALHTALRCIEACELLLKDEPENEAIKGLLSLVLRNAGVIEEVLGHDGTPAVKRAVDLASSVHPENQGLPVNHEIAAGAFLVDAKQMLGFLHLRHDRRKAALAAWLDAIDECQNLVRRTEFLARDQPAVIPVLRFRKAQRRLENDLQQLQSQIVGNRSDDSLDTIELDRGVSQRLTATSQWSWTSLRPSDGLSELAIDRLINATLPGEFEPQEAILVSWTADSSWSHATILKVLRAIQETTRVVLLVADDEGHEEAIETITREGLSFDRIDIRRVGTDTIWIRDYGPLTVKCDDGAIRIACSMFKDSFAGPAPANDFLSAAWSRTTGWPMFRLPVMVEGGALLSNGAGLCLVSETLLAKNAASGIGKRQVTDALKRLTGADQIVYLLPLYGEKTEHVDWFTVFTSPDTVVIGDYYGIDDVNSDILDENARRLSGIMTRSGPLRVERIPMPPRGKAYFGGTYTNVVFANGNLLVPTWPEASRKTEEKALSVYRRLLPDWKIIPIASPDLGRKRGSLHCATMNLYRYLPLQFRAGSDS